MTDMDNAIKLIDTLLKHEEAIAAFYELLAEKLPRYAEFWGELAKEERMHVRLVRTIEDEVICQSISVDSTKLSVQSVENSIQYVKEAHRLAVRSDMNMRTALATALDLEDSMVEKRVIEVFRANDEVVAELLTKFSDTFIHHSKKISAELRRIDVGAN